MRTRIQQTTQLALAICLSAVLFGACIQKAASTGSDGKESNTFGEKISAKGAVSIGALPTLLGDSDSLAVKLQGTVESVCQVKGCWMNLVDANNPGLFVQFKDYGFFMPKDIAGRQVVIDGYAYRQVTPVEELRHYAEDAGKTQEEIEAITTPKEEVKFLASGVLLLPESK
ncbi:MAG: hypothetical protein RLY31_2550 [Bacteroidota bacterium]|jgi:hypothetical protein